MLNRRSILHVSTLNIHVPFLKLYSLTRRWGLYCGPCPNLLREDRALILVPSDGQSGLLQSLDLRSLPDGRGTSYSSGCHQIFLIYYLCYLRYMCTVFLLLSDLVCCCSSVSVKKNIRPRQITEQFCQDQGISVCWTSCKSTEDLLIQFCDRFQFCR